MHMVTHNDLFIRATRVNFFANCLKVLYKTDQKCSFHYTCIKPIFLFANLEFTLVFGDSFCCVIALKIIVWKIPHKYIRNVILFYLHMWIRGKEIPVAMNKRTAIVITLTIRCYLIWCHKQCSLCHVFSISNMYVDYGSFYEIEMQISNEWK